VKEMVERHRAVAATMEQVRTYLEQAKAPSPSFRILLPSVPGVDGRFRPGSRLVIFGPPALV
jgi:hypothetical protein